MEFYRRSRPTPRPSRTNRALEQTQTRAEGDGKSNTARCPPTAVRHHHWLHRTRLWQRDAPRQLQGTPQKATWHERTFFSLISGCGMHQEVINARPDVEPPTQRSVSEPRRETEAFLSPGSCQWDWKARAQRPDVGTVFKSIQDQARMITWNENDYIPSHRCNAFARVPLIFRSKHDPPSNTIAWVEFAISRVRTPYKRPAY